MPPTWARARALILVEVAGALDLQRQERVLDLAVTDPRGALVAVAEHVAQSAWVEKMENWPPSTAMLRPRAGSAC